MERIRMTKTYKYPKTSFVPTDSLRKYRDRNNLTNKELALHLDEKLEDVVRWIYLKRVPKEVVNKINGRVSSITKKKSPGTLYVTYVEDKDSDSFKAFCSALKIDVKAVL